MPNGEKIMKKIKTILWVLLIGLIVLVVFQNQAYFLLKQHLLVNFYFAQYQTPDMVNGIYLLISFTLGLLIAYFINFADRMRLRKTIKKLNATISAKSNDLTALKGELDALQSTSIGSAADGPETGA